MFEISERAHAGLQLMAALASAYEKEERLRLKTIAEEAHISTTYLEEIAASLRKANLIEGRQGPGGGYRLTRAPKTITLEDISTALEGQVTLVDCQNTSILCPHEKHCRTKNIWHRLQKTIQNQLRTTSLQDLT